MSTLISLLLLAIIAVSVIILTPAGLVHHQSVQASTFRLSPDTDERSTTIRMNLTFPNGTSATLGGEFGPEFITLQQANAIIAAVESILEEEEEELFEPLEEEALEEDNSDSNNNGNGNGGGNGNDDDGDGDTGDNNDDDNEIPFLPPPPDNNNGNSTDDVNNIVVCIPEDRECTDEFLCPGEDTVWDISSQKCVPAADVPTNNDSDSDLQLVNTPCGPIHPIKSFCHYLPQAQDHPTAKEVAQKAAEVVDDDE